MPQQFILEYNSAVECYPYMVELSGSNPDTPTYRSVGQMVKTPHFLCGIRGSIPLRNTTNCRNGGTVDALDLESSS